MDANTQKIAVNAAVQLIGKLLADDNLSMGAYLLRHARFRILTNNGLAGRMTYPRPDETKTHGLESCFAHLEPVTIYRHGGASLGSKGKMRVVTC